MSEQPTPRSYSYEKDHPVYNENGMDFLRVGAKDLSEECMLRKQAEIDGIAFETLKQEYEQ